MLIFQMSLNFVRIFYCIYGIKWTKFDLLKKWLSLNLRFIKSEVKSSMSVKFSTIKWPFSTKNTVDNRKFWKTDKFSLFYLFFQHSKNRTKKDLKKMMFFNIPTKKKKSQFSITMKKCEKKARESSVFFVSKNTIQKKEKIKKH